MGSHKASSQSLVKVSTGDKTTASLHGAGLVVARSAWMIITLACLAIFFASIPAYWTVLQQVCSDSVDAMNICNNNNQLLQANIQTLSQSHISLGDYATIVVIIDIVSSLIFMLTGMLIFWRKSNEQFSMFVSLLLILFGALGPSLLNRSGILTTLYPTWQITLPVELFQSSIYPALGLFFYLFPAGRLVPRWAWVFFFAWIAQLFFYALPVDSPYYIQNLPRFLRLTIFLLAYGSAVGCQIYRYRRVSSRAQQQQTKWLIFGFAGTIVLKILSLTPVDPNTLGTPLLFFGVLIGYIALLPLPLAVGIALLRYQLWDIDQAINRALVYGSLTLTLILLYAGLVFGAQALLVGLIGNNDSLVIVASTLIVAVLFQPLRRGIQNTIDRRFYRQKYDAARTLQAFGAQLHQQTELTQLSEQIVAVVQETVQPAHVSLWVFKSGRTEALTEEGVRV